MEEPFQKIQFSSKERQTYRVYYIFFYRTEEKLACKNFQKVFDHLIHE